MFGRHHFPRFLLALSGVTVVFLLATPARAAIILADTGAGDGVLACLGEQCVYTPATENPAKAFNGTVESAMNQNGSFIRFAFTVSGGTGSSGSPPPLAGALLITILGTAGEPVGTPVSLQLNTFVTPDPGSDVTIVNFLNNTEYGVNTDVVINGLKVGDSFGYWPYISVLGNTGYIYQVDLSLGGTEIPTIPEPETLALLMTAGLSLGVVLLRRRGRIGKFIHSKPIKTCFVLRGRSFFRYSPGFRRLLHLSKLGARLGATKARTQHRGEIQCPRHGAG